MGWDRMGSVTANTRDKAEAIASWSAKQGRAIHVAWGKVSNPGNTEHYTGRAVDFMTFANAELTRHDRAIGDGIVAYLLRHRVRLGVYGIIWRQRLIGYSGGFDQGWRNMADRGSATANHYDHVHVLFSSSDLPVSSQSSNDNDDKKSEPKPKPKGQIWHVDPKKVSSFLWGLKNGRQNNIKAKPRRNIRIARWVKRGGRTWGVTAHNNWFAKSFLNKGRAPEAPRKPKRTKPRGTVYHVDPNKVSSFLWGLKGGVRKNVRAKPRRNIRIVRWAKRRGRTWGVTAHNNWFAKSFLKKGRSK